MNATQSISDPSIAARPPAGARSRKGGGPRAIARAGQDTSRDWSTDAVGIENPIVRVTAIAKALEANVRKRPIASLAAAIGVGFIVGGALSFRAGRILLTGALRHVGREALKQIL